VTAAVGLGVLAACYALTLAAGTPNGARWVLLALLGLSWASFALAARVLLRAPARLAVPLLVAGGLLLQTLAVSAAPRSTDDFYRYAWDGRVQAAGVDPYRYPPTDPALADLRDEWLFPGGQTRLNHPDVPTVYPPVAQAWFLAVHALSPVGARHKPWQLAAALLAMATTFTLVGLLRWAGGDPRLAVLWAWSPTAVLEAGNSAHVDVLGALLVVLALWAVAARRSAAGGALFGAAVAVKLLPALVLPAALRHRGMVVLAAATGLFGLSYLPHVLAVGPGVLGFLPGYLGEEGYGAGSRFALLRIALPDGAAPLAAAAILAATAALTVRRADPGRPWHAALPLVGVAFLLAAPNYPWYATLLVILVALTGRAEWLAVAAAAYPVYLAGALDLSHATTQQISYGTALLVLAGTTALAYRRSYQHLIRWRPAQSETKPTSISSRPPRRT